MLQLTLANAFHRPGRTLMVVLSVAAVVAEILILEGFLAGSYTQLRRAVLDRGGDVIVAQSGVRNFLAARSILPQSTRTQVEVVSGVAATHPLTALSLIYENGQRLTPVIGLVFDDTGGPAGLIAGDMPQGGREVVIDRSLAQRYGLQPGDPLTVFNFDFTVSGISDGAVALFTPFIFITFDGLIDFFFESDVASDIAAFPLLSFLAVDAAPGTDPDALANAIEAAVPGTTALLPAALAANDERLGRDLLGPVLNLLLGMSYAAGGLAIGLFMFASARSRQKSLGVLRALGFTPRHLLVGVLWESLLVAVIAVPIGVVLARLFAFGIAAWAPLYLVEIGAPVALFRTVFAVLMLSVLGSLTPLRSIARLDPAAAFRGA